MTNELARIQARHTDIPQDTLPIAIPTTGGGEPVKTRAQKSIKWAVCPHHVQNSKRLTGLVAIDHHTLAFREHSKRVGRHTIPCPGSGQIFEGTPYDQPA